MSSTSQNRALASLLTFLLAAAFAPAQQVTGSITGTVSDPSGSAVAGASVKLVSEETAAERVGTTNAAGSFIFTAVTPGKYTVSAEHRGFRKFQKQHIELVPGDNLAVGSLPLEVGTVNESVTVQAEGAMLQTTSGERAGIITSQEINNLTVMNRDFTTFAELQPGIVINVGAEVQTFSGNNTFNVLGGRTTGNNILIDGIPSTNSNQGNMNTTLSLDGTQSVEVKVANFDAEYGRNQGVTIMAVSKGGTQQYHGAAYYYDRNEAFNANNFFNNRSGLPKQEYRISTAGGTFGGPLHVPRVPGTKGKLFFFVASEEIREKRPETEQTLTVPTALERQGNFSQSLINNKPITIKDPNNGKPFAGNIIPSTRILLSTQAYLNLLPLPNFSNNAISNGQYDYIFEESLNVPKRIETGRIDYNLSSSTIMYARFNYWYEDQQGNAVSAGNSKWGWMPQHYTAVTPSGVVALTHIFNATTVLQASMGYQRFNESGPPLSDSEYTALSRTKTGVNIPQFNPSINPYDLVPAASFGGVSGTSADIANPGYASRFPLYGVENTFNWNGTINKVIGAHTMKAGIYAERWRAMKGLNASNFAGNMNFGTDSNNPQDTGDAYSNALLGVLDSYTESSSRPPQYEFTGSIEWFAQDDWKITHNFTLDFGVRFGWAVPWHSNHLQEAGFVPSLWNPANEVSLINPVLVSGKRMGKDPITGKILPAVDIGAIAPEAGNPINGIVYRLTDPSFPEGLHSSTGIKTAPRLSFAWDPFGSGKTVVRGGGGVFYELHDIDNYGYGIEYTPPIQYNPVINYTTVQTFINQAGYNSPSTIAGFDPVYHTPVTYNFSFGVQQDIGFGTVLDVAYVGALARHLTLSENLNAAPLGTDWQPQNLDPTTHKPLANQFTRPYIGYGDIIYYFQGGNSSYHSLQTTLRRRYKNNLTYGLVWTWSKAMDYSDTGTSSSSTRVNPWLPWSISNYGEAGYDHTQIFRLYWNYNLPNISSFLNNRFVRAAFDDWQISGIYTAQSGAPMGVSYSFSPSQDILGSSDTTFARTIITGDPNQIPANSNLLAFNPAAIGAPPVAACEVPNPPSICWGNASKDVFRGPGLNNWDTSLFKNFPIYRERLWGQFRVEAYNVFNHTQFTTVNTSATFNASGAQTNGLFGQYTAAADGRRLQLALRLTF